MQNDKHQERRGVDAPPIQPTLAPSAPLANLSAFLSAMGNTGIGQRASAELSRTRLAITRKRTIPTGWGSAPLQTNDSKIDSEVLQGVNAQSTDPQYPKSVARGVANDVQTYELEPDMQGEVWFDLRVDWFVDNWLENDEGYAYFEGIKVPFSIDGEGNITSQDAIVPQPKMEGEGATVPEPKVVVTKGQRSATITVNTAVIYAVGKERNFGGGVEWKPGGEKSGSPSFGASGGVNTTQQNTNSWPLTSRATLNVSEAAVNDAKKRRESQSGQEEQPVP